MKKQANPNPSPIKSKSRYLTCEQAKAILEFLDRPELPEHDSPFKLYFNGKLVASAMPTKPIEGNNSQNDNNTLNSL